MMRLNALMLLVSWSVPADAQPPGVKVQRPKEVKFAVGDPAPAFELKLLDGENGKKVKLSDLKGKPVVLVFGSCT